MIRTLSLLSFLVSVAIAQDAAPPPNAQFKTWKYADGRTSPIRAKYAGSTDTVIKVQRQDNGAIVELPIAQLAPAELAYVKALLAPPPAAKGAAAGGNAGDWPRWRGPVGDGISKETGLLDDWNTNPPALLWSAKGFGSGMSSVAVSNGKIYTMGNKGGTQLICADEKDGNILWSAKLPGGGDDPNCTPTVDPQVKLVFALGKNGDLLCADAETGKEVWTKSFSSDFGGKMMSGWGYSESPLVDGDRLIVTPGGDQAVMAALDKRTGKVIWQTAKDGLGGAGYASPVISNGGGVKQYLTLVGRGLISVDAKDGKFLWHYDRIANGTANIPTPLVSGDHVFASTGYNDGGTGLLKLKRSGAGVAFDEVYYKKNNVLQNHHGGMVMIGDYIYMGHGHNNGFPVCVEWKTGDIKWGPDRGPGKESAALLAADGDLYFRYQDGTMALIEASPAKRTDKGSFKIATRARESWPHPVIAHKKLYLRDQDHLHCYDLAKK
jgi:outer membrane protein assembly factor BamB